jgi:hypothetical protein
MTPFFINHNGLSESKLLDRRRHGIDRVVIDAGVVGIGSELGNFPRLHVHGRSPENSPNVPTFGKPILAPS